MIRHLRKLKTRKIEPCRQYHVSSIRNHKIRYEDPMFHMVFKCGKSMGEYSQDTALVPTYVDCPVTRYSSISTGLLCTFLVGVDGVGYTWGFNEYRNMGLPETNQQAFIDARRISGLKHKNLTQIAAGRAHTLFLSDDGFVFAAGSLEFGQLGNGRMEKLMAGMPSNVLDLPRDIVSISAGLDHNMALTSDGEVYGWGLNYEGQLGIGNNENVSVPVRISSLQKIRKIECGFDFSMALNEDGELFGFGMGEMHQLGNGDADDKNLPYKLPFNEKIVDFSCGGGSSLAKSESGKIYSWGIGVNGQLGNNSEDTQTMPRPIQYFEENECNISKFSSGGGHHLALEENGTLYAWGYGDSGRLGTGNTSNQLVPTEVLFFEGKKIAYISASSDHSVVVTEEDFNGVENFNN
eukprot:TRINITY_DN10538_c0_g1_i1.p1 TRINITY_DN10538_c0_g1~~TRINITY_DN10538_c0_g1_i1.p1  ORF type:complete len:407 (+),score=97.61 TRINITY_DN10538_c0_g1_i1:1-1221(+)